MRRLWAKKLVEYGYTKSYKSVLVGVIYTSSFIVHMRYLDELLGLYMNKYHEKLKILLGSYAIKNSSENI